MLYWREDGEGGDGKDRLGMYQREEAFSLFSHTTREPTKHAGSFLGLGTVVPTNWDQHAIADILCQQNNRVGRTLAANPVLSLSESFSSTLGTIVQVETGNTAGLIFLQVFYRFIPAPH